MHCVELSKASGCSSGMSLSVVVLICALRVCLASVLICANSVLCARSTPPCDCELYAPEFLVAMLPFLFATAVISAVRKSPDLVVVWFVMFFHIE